MDLAEALADLDDHPWASVSHAYGPAEDLPELLRAFAGGGEDGEEARDELYSALLHQGTVYPASVAAVPFLVRIAAAGCEVVETLVLLGGMAESDDEREIPGGAVRAAVVGQLPLLLPLSADEDGDVRGVAAAVLGRLGEAGDVLPALRGRWAVEQRAEVRAELLLAMGRLDPGSAVGQAHALLGEATPRPLRLAALMVCLNAGDPWNAAHHTAALAVLPTRELDVDRTGMHHRELLPAAVEDLFARGTEADREAALALTEAALRDERPGVRFEALLAADQACERSRAAARRLVPAIAPHAGGSDLAERLLGRLGPVAADAAPVLLRLAEQADDKSADRALAVLVRVAPRQAAPLLARDLDRRPRALDAAGHDLAPAFPFDPALLTAVRARLATEGIGGRETVRLVHLLYQWGGRAAAGLPELYAALPHTRYAATAIAAVATDRPQPERREAAAVLRAAAGPLIVARAHHRLTGEPDVLLAAVIEGLTVPRELDEAVQGAAELGPAAVELLPALRAAISTDAEPTTPQLDTDIAIATALRRIGGDAGEAVRILGDVLDRVGNPLWFRWTVLRAVRAAAQLGPAARPLVPRLEALLDQPENAPTAILALLRIAGPEALDLTRLAGIALGAVDAGFDIGGACEALHALGSDALDARQRRRVAELVEGDRRIVRPGTGDELVREDEQWRELLSGL
ncbi:hypothetical protein ABTZ03_00740 [Kitasatospora sp. NPDC096077]|uniref:hypothetical protein n=1 Tax=Kitasatospora sp. NPDC096077 TaxID=3155544 RepID=UPI00333276E4